MSFPRPQCRTIILGTVSAPILPRKRQCWRHRALRPGGRPQSGRADPAPPVRHRRPGSAQRFGGPEIHSGIATAVEQDVLRGQVAGLGGTNRRTKRPALRARHSGPPDWNARARPRPARSSCPGTGPSCPGCGGPARRWRNARQQVVDGDVVPHGLARDAADETDRQRAPLDRPSSACGALTLRDTMLTMREAALDHAVDHAPDHVDGTQHHSVQGGDPVLVRPVAEVSGQRPVGVVDQDVRMRAGGDARRVRPAASGRPRPSPRQCRFRARSRRRPVPRSGLRAAIVTDTPSRASCCAQARPCHGCRRTPAPSCPIPRSMLSPCRSMPQRLSGELAAWPAVCGRSQSV